jgi:hypothetical protein
MSSQGQCVISWFRRQFQSHKLLVGGLLWGIFVAEISPDTSGLRGFIIWFSSLVGIILMIRGSYDLLIIEERKKDCEDRTEQ